MNNYVKKDSPEVAADLDMKGFAIKNLKVTPGGDASATSRKYVDRKLGTKADKNELNGYLKLDGSNQMSANPRMNNKRITGLANVPTYDGEATNKKYVDVKLNDKVDKNDLNGYLKLDGTSQMQGNLVMNDKRITGLTNPPNNDDEATNKKYVDTHISKSNIKPSHSPKNVFQYLMDDVNEWWSEYNVIVGSFSDLPESLHSWDKKVLNITPVKSGRNYRFRLGLQPLRMKNK